MKIRSGFVSNSSSSSYIVEVPKEFSIKINDISSQIIEDMPDHFVYDKNTDLPTSGSILYVTGILNNMLNKLHSGQCIYCMDNYEAFWALTKILEDNNFLVMCVDGAGGDGEDTIIPFKDRRKE